MQDDGLQPPSAAFCRGTRYTVELFGRTRPPLQARANAKPQGKGQSTLDLTWTAIRYEGAKGKGKGLLPERAIWHARNNPEVPELTEATASWSAGIRPLPPPVQGTSLRSSCPEAATLTR